MVKNMLLWGGLRKDEYASVHTDIVRGNQYHVSFGVSEMRAEDTEMEKLLKNAEYRMREAKEQYYQVQGRSRSR